MNYEDMSDFEINKRVFPHTRNFEKCDDVMQNKNEGRNGFMWGDGANWFEFDPCNVANEAWPIIVNNHIATIPTGRFSGWCAIHKPDVDGNNQIHANILEYDSNPLRAAMICFLKMKAQ